MKTWKRPESNDIAGLMNRGNKLYDRALLSSMVGSVVIGTRLPDILGVREFTLGDLVMTGVGAAFIGIGRMVGRRGDAAHQDAVGQLETCVASIEQQAAVLEQQLVAGAEYAERPAHRLQVARSEPH